MLLDEKLFALTGFVPQKRPVRLRSIYQDGAVHLVESQKLLKGDDHAVGESEE